MPDDTARNSSGVSHGQVEISLTGEAVLGLVNIHKSYDV
jgi:hypothetical protein